MEHDHIAPAEQNSRAFELKLLYAFAGSAAALAYLLGLYYSLRMNSSIRTLIETTAHAPLYLAIYSILTVATVIAFGMHASLLVKRFRTMHSIKRGGTVPAVIGGAVGIFASACPSCGSILLASIGIAGGLLAFPLEGLELKTLSFLFVLVPLLMLRRKMRRDEARCADGTCPEMHEDTFKESDKKWVAILGIASIILALIGLNMARSEFAASASAAQAAAANPEADALFAEMTEKVIPAAGFQSKIKLGGAIVALAENHVIDIAKTDALYKKAGQSIPEGFAAIISKPEETPIHLTQENALYYLNALWALGLANHMETNRTSPVAGKDLFNFASTGGWTLGAADNGGAYFNTLPIVVLSPEQESLVRAVAENTYRPCCDNSSFFQDCNHGSALLGLLELGASQGLNEDELYAEALHFNAYWFPQPYVEAAMYFKAVEGIEWERIDPRLIMSKQYSSASGWYANIFSPLKAKGLLPSGQIGGTGC